MISRDQIRVKFVCQAKLFELLGNNNHCRLQTNKYHDHIYSLELFPLAWFGG